MNAASDLRVAGAHLSSNLDNGEENAEDLAVALENLAESIYEVTMLIVVVAKMKIYESTYFSFSFDMNEHVYMLLTDHSVQHFFFL